MDKIKIIGQRIRLDVGSDFIDDDDKEYGFTSIFQAFLMAYEISNKEKITVKIVLDSITESEDYKTQNIAVINAKLLDVNLNKYYRPEYINIKL